MSRADIDARAESSADEHTHDSELEAHYHAQFQRLYGTPTTLPISSPFSSSPNSPTSTNPHLKIDDDETYEFRLFARSITKSITAPQRITLRSPTPASGEPGFVVPERGNGYYFTGPISKEEGERFREVAVSGEDVMEQSGTRWVGFSTSRVEEF